MWLLKINMLWEVRKEHEEGHSEPHFGELRLLDMLEGQ
jgi:hypothetical protein